MSTIPLAKVDPKTPGYERLHKQAVELEGVFLNTLMKEMFSSGVKLMRKYSARIPKQTGLSSSRASRSR